MSKTTIRYAVVSACPLTTAAYLPRNYEVLCQVVMDVDRRATLIMGSDEAGWGLDTYVLPRLASGLYFGTEIDRATADNLERVL